MNVGVEVIRKRIYEDLISYCGSSRVYNQDDNILVFNNVGGNVNITQIYVRDVGVTFNCGGVLTVVDVCSPLFFDILRDSIRNIEKSKI